VALGTDGYPSDMPAEQAALERRARMHAGAAEVQAAASRLATGRELAAELFGAEALAGDAVEFEPRDEGEPARARRVGVAGRVVVEGGRLVAADLEEIRAHAREEAARLWRRMEALPP
jgi:hypothetical protein